MQNRQNDGLFRKKSLERVTSPEKLNDYIRVTTPPVWLVLSAVTVLLLGIIAWSIFGSVEKKNPDGTTEEVAPISYIIN